MRFTRWAGAMAMGILLVICVPVAAVASEPDDCADAGLVSSLLGKCGLLGGLLGEPDPAEEDPGTVDPTAPAGDAPADTSDPDGTSGSPGDTSGGSTGPDGGGDTTGTPSGSSSDVPDTPTGRLADPSDHFMGTGPAGSSTAGPYRPGVSDSGGVTGSATDRPQSTNSGVPAKVVGPLSHLLDAPQAAGQAENLPQAAGVPTASRSPGPVVGVALILITAGIFAASTGLWTAIWRNAGRAEA